MSLKWIYLIVSSDGEWPMVSGKLFNTEIEMQVHWNARDVVQQGAVAQCWLHDMIRSDQLRDRAQQFIIIVKLLISAVHCAAATHMPSHHLLSSSVSGLPKWLSSIFPQSAYDTFYTPRLQIQPIDSKFQQILNTGVKKQVGTQEKNLTMFEWLKLGL